MSIISSMREKTLNKIGDVVEMMAIAVEDGGSAADSLRKQAQDLNLTADQVRLAARSYNVGSVAGTRKTAGVLSCVSQIRSKIDNAEYVDPEPIVKDLFESKSAAPKAVYHSTAIDPVYSEPFADPLYLQEEKDALRKKATDEGLKLFNDVTAPKLPFHEERSQMAPWNWYKVQKSAVEKAQMAKAAAQDKVQRSMTNLQNYFLATTPGDRVEWVDFKKRASRIFGDCIEPIVARISHSLPKDMLRKTAAVDKSDATKGPYRLTELCILAFDDLSKADNALKAAEIKLKEAADKVPKGKAPTFVKAGGVSLLGLTKEAIKKREQNTVMDVVQREDNFKMAIRRSEAAGGQPTKKRSSLLQLMAGKLPDPNEGKSKTASTFAPIFASTLGAGVGREIGSHIPGAMPVEKLEDRAYNSLTDPAQEQELAGIRAESMLSNMINSDDVLAHQDPNVVISHYNELSQLAPNLMQQPAAARAILRQVLTTGGMTPYDIQQLQTMNQIGQRPPRAATPGAV